VRKVGCYMKIETSAFQVALRFTGIKEIPGNQDHPFIVWCLSLCGLSAHDETPWCSAFVNGICYILGLPRSGSAAARSWLNVGTPTSIDDAHVGLDVVVLSRGEGIQPGPEEINAPGHVGFFSCIEGDRVKILGGNQSDMVSIESFPVSQILGIRRLA
jgi:uncharacterized protein (TIGR02594 family)